MFSVTVQQLGDASVLCCKGRIVIGGAYSMLRNAARSQEQAQMLILDLAWVDRIDAGGLGVLLSVREWARSGAVRFKLMNVTRNVEQILELTNLQSVFEFCSVRDLLCLLHRAASVKSWRERANPTENDSREYPGEGQDGISPMRSPLFAVAS
jgi:anti-anti-sigma factor